MTEDVWETIVRVYLKGHFPLLRRVLDRWRTVKPPRIEECSLQLEATVTAIHEPATRPEGEHFRIVEAHVQRVHALSNIVKGETNYIDPQHWSPLFYIFRHYFATGQEIARSFRAED